MKRKTVLYRGALVTAGWPEKIEQAQRVPTCKPNGVELARIRYGAQAQDWGADQHACHDCHVIKGEFHVPGCDAESCPACGGQKIACDCLWPGDAGYGRPVKAAKPFSKREELIVAARRLFKWRLVGFAASNDVIIEVSNGSAMCLPYLSIGIQGKGGTILIGGLWLNVSGIKPGETALVQRAAYDALSSAEVECFAMEDPVPETRDRYWEFKRMPG